MSQTLDFTQTLISHESVTPHDGGCQKLISERLSPLGFKIEALRFENVDNLWARHGTEAPLFVFAGHTDVVPPGPLAAWESDPFQPTIRDGLLFGRGAADMKSGLAAMVMAAENFIKNNPGYPGSIGFLITSDEEGPSINGTKKVIETLEARAEKMNYCIIGEASSKETLGDEIRVGRRGSFHGHLTIKGKQGHVAYPHLANNAIHASLSALQTLVDEKWDAGNEFFPPTSFQLTQLHAGTGATNVIPGELEVKCNFRFSPAITVEDIQKRIAAILASHNVQFDAQWELSGVPFLTKQGKLIDAVQRAIKEIADVTTTLSTDGGTSDGRFIAPTGAEVIELGPIRTSIHQANEHVNIADLDKLTAIYERTLEKLFL